MYILLILTLCLSKNSCPLFTCSPEHLYLLPSTCVFFDNSRYTPAYYIQPCQDPSLPYCSFNLNQNSSCTASPLSSYTGKFPGEKCKSDSDCISRSCLSQICEGKAINSKCKANSECSPGLFCSSQTCTLLKDTGASCKSTFECETSAGCLKGKCVKYWTASTGTSIDDCNEYGESFFCESGKCENNKCTSTKKNLSMPSLCTADTDCPSVCECGRNLNANRYCRLEGGDSVYSTYLSLVKEFTQSQKNSLCNTERRTSADCAADRWDLGKAIEMKELEYYVHHYSSIVEHDDCTLELFVPDYSLPETPIQLSSSLPLVPLVPLLPFMAIACL